MEMERELGDLVETWAPVFPSPFLISSPAWFTFSSDHFSHLQSGESKPWPPLPWATVNSSGPLSTFYPQLPPTHSPGNHIEKWDESQLPPDTSQLLVIPGEKT